MFNYFFNIYMSVNKPIFQIPIDLIVKDIKNKSYILKENQLEESRRIIFINNGHYINSQTSQRTTNIGDLN